METSPQVNIRPPFWWARWVPATLLLIGLIVLVILIGGTVLVPLLASFALALMLEPLADWFQRSGRSRNASVLFTLATAVLVIVMVLVFLLPSVYHQLGESFDKIPLALRAVAARAQQLLNQTL